MKITFLLNSFQLYLKQELPTIIRAKDDSDINIEFLFKVNFQAWHSFLCTAILKIGENKSAGMFRPAGWGIMRQLVPAANWHLVEIYQ